MTPEERTALKTFVSRLNSDIEQSRENATRRIINEIRINAGLYPDDILMCDIDVGENSYGFRINYDIDLICDSLKSFEVELSDVKNAIRSGLSDLIMG